MTQELGYLAIHGALHLVGFGRRNRARKGGNGAEMNLVALDAGLKPDEHWASILHGEVRVR